MDNQINFKSLDKSIRKQKIIHTAADIFQKKGYRSATLDDISKELNVTKAALYHYVSSKDELLSIIYTHTIKNIFMPGAYEILGMKNLPPDEKLRLFIRNHIKNIIIESLPMFSVFFSEENQLPEREYQKIRKEKEKYNHILEKILKEGISKGIFNQVDAKLQSYAIIGMCNWIYKWYKTDQKKYTADEIADHFIELLESGYLKDKAVEGDGHFGKSKAAHTTNRLETKKQALYDLKAKCIDLIKFIERTEKSKAFHG